MAFENFPAAANQEMETPPKFNWLAPVAGFLFLALILAICYIFWHQAQSIESSKDKVIQEKTAPVVKANGNDTLQQNELQKELAVASVKYDSLRVVDAQKDSVNKVLAAGIVQKRDSIYFLLKKENATQSNLVKAKTLIASLKDNIEGYKVNIEKVNNEKIILVQQKQLVEKQRSQARDSLDSAYVIIKQKEDTIDIGSTLNAVDFTILSISEKSSGKEKETSVARKVNKLRISFEIGQNRIAPSGIKQIFVCVTDPNGSPIAVEALGSGKFMTRDGTLKYYTQQMDVKYIQGAPHQIISFDWKQNTEFQTGDYKIEIYNNGFKIGEGVSHLK